MRQCLGISAAKCAVAMLGFLSLGRVADAAAPEACWSNNQDPLIVGGLFQVHVATKLYDKDQLLALLRQFTYNINLQPAGFPFIEDNNQEVIFDIQAVNQDDEETNAQFQDRINSAIRQYEALPGVVVTCEKRHTPDPAVTGSN